MKQETKQTSTTEPRFNYQDLDSEINKPDLQKWVDADELHALVDESKGGIIGYIHHSHVDEITGLLNDATTPSPSIHEEGKFTKGKWEIMDNHPVFDGKT